MSLKNNTLLHVLLWLAPQKFDTGCQKKSFDTVILVLKTIIKIVCIWWPISTKICLLCQRNLTSWKIRSALNSFTWLLFIFYQQTKPQRTFWNMCSVHQFFIFADEQDWKSSFQHRKCVHFGEKSLCMSHRLFPGKNRRQISVKWYRVHEFR